MIIGVPKEIKENEYRVALTPAGAQMLTARRHTVLVEHSAASVARLLQQLQSCSGVACPIVDGARVCRFTRWTLAR